MDEDDLVMIYWTYRLDQIRSVRPDSNRVDEGLEFLLEALILDSEKSRIDSAEEHEDTSSQRDCHSDCRQGFAENQD